MVPLVLYRLYRRFAVRSHEQERWGFRVIGFTTVTGWGVYPLGYLLTLTSLDLNYIHLAFSVADIFNKVGVAVVAYLVGKRLLDERLEEQALMPGHAVA